MRFTSAILAAAALASSALAQTAGFAVMTSPTQDQEIPAGSSFDLIWTPGTPTGPISIVLLQGDTAATLQVGATLATGVPSTLGKFTYTVPATSSFKTYGFKITLDSDPKIFQYSFPFHVSGAYSGAPAPSSSSSSGSATKSGTASSSSISSSSNGSAKSSTYHHSSSVTGVTTTVPAPTGASNATIPATGSVSTSAAPVASPYSNGTTLLSTTAVPTGSSPSPSTAGGSSSASSTPASVTPNAAVAKVASAGLALGGLFMAFAL